MKLKKIIATAMAIISTVTTNAQSSLETVSIDGPNGKLVADIFKPDLKEGAKVDLVIQMHGFKANRRGALLDAIFNTISTTGMGALRFDFDGCGQSDGSFVDMTVPKEIDDAMAVFEYARQLPWVNKIYLVGHSQGGVVASMTAGKLGKDKVSGLVLLAPAAVLREDAIRGNTQGAHYDPMNPPESVEVAPGFFIGREYILTAQTLPIYDTAKGYRGPAFMIHGTGDIVVPYTYSLLYNEIFDNGTVDLLYGVGHSFNGHEQEAADLIKNYLTLTVRSYCL